MTDLKELRSIKATLADNEAKRRTLTELEERLLHVMCEAFAQSRENCCSALSVVEGEMKPLIDKYVPDFDVDDYR